MALTFDTNHFTISSFLEESQNVIYSLFLLVVILAVLKFAFELLQSKQANWQLSLALSIFGMLLSALQSANDTTRMFYGYDTTTPLSTYYVQYWLGVAARSIGSGFSVFLLSCFVTAAIRRFLACFSFKQFYELAFCRQTAATHRLQRRMYIDAFLTILQIGTLCAVFYRGTIYFGTFYAHEKIPVDFSWAGALDGADKTSLLAAWALAQMGNLMVFNLVAGFLTLTWRRFCSQPLVGLSIWLFLSLLGGICHYPVDYALSVISSIFSGIILWIVLRATARNPFLLLMSLWVEALGSVLEAKSLSSGLFTVEFTIMFAIVALPLLWCLWIQLTPQKRLEALHSSDIDLDSPANANVQNAHIVGANSSAADGPPAPGVPGTT